jgi:hypothetical protein
MTGFRHPLTAFAAVTLATPASAQPTIPYGPPHRAEGTYRSAFETSSFGDCWVRFTDRGSAEFHRLRPAGEGPGRGRGHSYRVSWLIRRTPDSTGGPWQGYGHLGGSPCQVEVMRVYSVA